MAELLFGPERLALLEAGYPAGESNEELLAKINALPGPPIERQQMQDRAKRARLSRPQWFVAIANGGQPLSVERQELVRKYYGTLPRAALLEAVNKCSGPPVPMKQLYVWAKRHGLTRPRAIPTSKPPADKRPIAVPLRLIYQWGAMLGVPRSKRGNVRAVSQAMRREDPTHPGFSISANLAHAKYFRNG